VNSHASNTLFHFPDFISQDRVTDHRVGLNVSSVERVLNAESLDPIIDALTIADEQERLEFFLDSLDLKRKEAEAIKKK
jgi:stalled ribosome rescue protein Dom34